jgi:hypothetical protein
MQASWSLSTSLGMAVTQVFIAGTVCGTHCTVLMPSSQHGIGGEKNIMHFGDVISSTN